MCRIRSTPKRKSRSHNNPSDNGTSNLGLHRRTPLSKRASITIVSEPSCVASEVHRNAKAANKPNKHYNGCLGNQCQPHMTHYTYQKHTSQSTYDTEYTSHTTNIAEYSQPYITDTAHVAYRAHCIHHGHTIHH